MIINEKIEKITRLGNWIKKGLIKDISINSAGEVVIEKKRFNEDGEEITPVKFTVPLEVIEAEINDCSYYLNTLKKLYDLIIEIDKKAFKGLDKKALKILKKL